MNLKSINPKKILIVNTFGIGDVLFTTPFIHNLKENLPDCSIAYVGNKRTAPLLESYDKVDKVFIYERDEFNALYKASKFKFYKKSRDFLKTIKNEHFDLVFDFSLNSTMNFFIWMVGIKHRIGFNYKNRSLFLTEKVPFEGFETKHVVDYYLELLANCGCEIRSRSMEMTISQEDLSWADHFLSKQDRDLSQGMIGIIPGAGASWGKEAKYRRWNPLKYAKLVDKIVEKYSLPIILMGDQSEGEICSKVNPNLKPSIIEAYGKTTIGQLAALLSRCKLVILNDGGPLHMAVAVKTKTLSIFGPVDDTVYGPYGSPQDHAVITTDIACRPCYRRFRMTKCEHISCLKNIEVDDVFNKVDVLLK